MTTRLELRGFRADHDHFLLAIACSNVCNKGSNPHSSSETAVRILERDFVDLQSWDRQLRRASSSSNCQRLPTKRLRKLMAANWLRDDPTAGWRVELQKNVSACEDWLNAAFAQLSTLQQQEFLDEDLYAAAKHKRITAREDSKYAKDLQQYFSSTNLVDLVVSRVLEHLEQRDVVWLEPSCGDGRFLTALLRAGARHVVGYEIDERLQSVAERNVELVATDVAGDISAEGSEVRAHIYLGDFLASKCCLPADKFVVAVGNPPFGAKGDDGRDLVHNFFTHVAREWRARVIAFIVPKRCARHTFVTTTLQQLNDAQSHATASSWELKMEVSLSEYQFEFGAGDRLKHVRQPSVLQLYDRK